MKRSTLFKMGIALLIVPQYGLVMLAKQNPNWVEAVYSNTVYPIVCEMQQVLFGSVSFSVGDVLYLMASILFCVWTFSIIRHFKRKFKTAWIDVLVLLSVVHFLFYCIWGLNYYRIPLYEKLHYDTTYSEEALACTLEQLIVKVNTLHLQLVSQEDEKVGSPYGKKELVQKVASEFYFDQDARIIQPVLKMSLWSLPLTYMGYAGYVNPFTLEAQANKLLPELSLVTTSAHEMAHQLGYAPESEANFIAFLSCIQHSDPYIQFAGYTFALRYCYSDLYRSNPERATALAACLHSGIVKNFNEMSSFWKRYENPLEPLFKSSYDAYLKANGQKAGIKSYNGMVGLVVHHSLLD